MSKNNSSHKYNTNEPFCVLGIIGNCNGSGSSQTTGNITEPFCAAGFIGDCGGSQTTSSNIDVDHKTITNSDTKYLTEQLNKHITNTVQTASSACGLNVDASQTVGLGNCKKVIVHGSLNFSNITMTQKVKANFSCVQISSFMQGIVQKLSNDFSNMMNQKLSNTDKNKLDTSNAAQATSQFLSTMPNTNTSTNVNYHLTTEANTSTTLQNIFKTVMEKNLNSTQIQSCISQIAASQNVGKSCKDGVGEIDNSDDINFTNITLDQSVDALATCLNKNTSIINTMSQLQNAVNNAVTNNLSNDVSSDTKTSNTSINKAEGVFSVFSEIGKMFGSMQAIIIVFIVVGAIVAVIGGYMYMQQGGQLPTKSGSGGGGFKSGGAKK